MNLVKINRHIFGRTEITGIKVKFKFGIYSIPFDCKLNASDGFARALKIYLPHGQVETPVYMPVGTKAAMKGVTQIQMEQLGCNILLANTYHLAAQPGGDFIESLGGLHLFSGWRRNILTDSGGYQMVSFGQLSSVEQLGVTFQNPYGGENMFLKPEDSIKIQNKIGADIIMALDDVVKTTQQNIQRLTEATQRTSRWLIRCFGAHKKRTDQALFPIVQGGISTDLREKSISHVQIISPRAYAIGGLSGGENKHQFFKIVKLCCDRLPFEAPRYLMGVGHPVDLVLCSALGVDMFDCVFATRTARFGTALTSKGQIKLSRPGFEEDFGPIQQGCSCETCKHFSRAYLNMIRMEDNFGHLVSIHNLHFLLSTMRQVRQAIIEKRLPQFVKKFIEDIYSECEFIPDWVNSALVLANLNISLEKGFKQQTKTDV